MNDERSPSQSVLGRPLELCGTDPETGYYRDGCCNTGSSDAGSHTICAIMTQSFLDFSKSQGNDLSTPRAEFGFPGLRSGDTWCLCASRWKEAKDAGVAPPVRLQSSHERALEIVSLEELLEHAIGDTIN